MISLCEEVLMVVATQQTKEQLSSGVGLGCRGSRFF